MEKISQNTDSKVKTAILRIIKERQKNSSYPYCTLPWNKFYRYVGCRNRDAVKTIKRLLEEGKLEQNTLHHLRIS